MLRSKKIIDGVFWVGAVDFSRRLFDALVPLPDGTSYNAYLVKGSEKTALVDTVDPATTATLMHHLDDVERLDYIVANHAEQDHSGSIPAVLEKYKDARVVANEKCRGLLMEHLSIPEEKFVVVKDGETLDLGGKTLEFISTPWVHWPETMCTYLREGGVLFSCDLFGSHIASAVFLANALKPKLKFAAIIGSYGWGSRMVPQLKGFMSGLKLDYIESVEVKGEPGRGDLKALEELACEIKKRHVEAGLIEA